MALHDTVDPLEAIAIPLGNATGEGDVAPWEYGMPIPPPQQLIEYAPSASLLPSPPAALPLPVQSPLDPQPTAPPAGEASASAAAAAPPLPPAEPLPPPDAISGVDAAPLPLPEPEEERALAQRGLDPESLQRLDPVAFSLTEAKHQIARDDAQATRELEVARADREEAERNESAYQQARVRASERQAKLDADADALSKQPIEDRSWAQRIVGAIAIGLGAVAAAKTGGPNYALQIIQGATEQALAERKLKLAEISSRQGVVTDEMKSAAAAFHHDEAFRIASLVRAAREVEIEQQKYDQKGTTVLRLERLRRQILGDAESRRAAATKEMLDQEIRVGEYELKVSAEQRALRKDAASVPSPAAARSPDYFRALGLPAPPFPMSDTEHETWMRRSKIGAELGEGGISGLERRKQEAEVIRAEAEAEAAKTGFQIAHPETGMSLVQPDGTPLVVMDATKRTRLGEVLSSAANIRRLADTMALLKKKYGGATKALGTEEAQVLQSLTAQIDFETFVGFDLGAPSEGDKELAVGVRGGADPTSFIKNATHGMMAYADGVERKANTQLLVAGYRGDPIRLTREADLPAPKLTPREEDLKHLITSEYGTLTTKRSDVIARGKTYVDPLSEEAPAAIDTTFRSLVKSARAGSASAWKDLETISKSAVSATLRERAKLFLVERPREGAPPRPAGAPAPRNPLLYELPGGR